MRFGGGGDSLPGDGETRDRLLESARQEFMEKGYMRASLRNICKNAGVTTGALYFFFQDKEDLFASLVETPLQKLYETMLEHYRLELEQVHGNESSHTGTAGTAAREPHADDQETAARLVHYIYQYHEEFKMLLTRSQGSRFEHSVEQFVEITEQHYRILANETAEKKQMRPAEDYLIHWMSHMTVDMFVHLLTHEPSEQAALQHVKPIVQYMTAGWDGLFCEKGDKDDGYEDK